MDSKTFGARSMRFVSDNVVDLVAGAATIAGGVAVYKAGEAAVVTTCLVGGGIAAAFVAFHGMRGVVAAAIAAPAAAKRMFDAAKERMDKPDVQVRQPAAAVGS